MQTEDYNICLSFAFYYKDEQKYFDDNPYNTENTKYSFKLANVTENSVKNKIVQLFCVSTGINEKINPKDYANIVYDMIGAFLVKKYIKITKEVMDKNKTGMDYEIIEKYKYPALFKNQKYVFDEEEDGILYMDDDAIKIKEEYIKYYGE
jgi:hypothetical protein